MKPRCAIELQRPWEIRSLLKGVAALTLFLVLSDCGSGQSIRTTGTGPPDKRAAAIPEDPWQPGAPRSYSGEFVSGVHFQPAELLSVDRFVSIVCPASLIGIDRILIRDVNHRHPEVEKLEYIVERQTSTRLRMQIRGLRSEVVQGHDYWELIFLDITLTSLGRESALAARLRASELALPGSALESALAEPQETFELSVVASGRYAAGGRPGSMGGYARDFEATGFGAELEWYAAKVLGIVQHHLGSRIAASYNREGAPTNRDVIDLVGACTGE
jgi:hypothetical protein